MSHAVGELVRARGREWVVLPGTDDEVLMVRPVGGSEDGTTGLLMALKRDPVRLLIADDPQLAEQWQRELRDKFHLDAQLVLPSTVRRLERHLSVGESLFDVHPYTVVSTDIKSDRRRPRRGRQHRPGPCAGDRRDQPGKPAAGAG